MNDDVKKGDDQESILGLSTSELAGLSVEEITNNETAIKMVMHYYKKLVDDNRALRNENNTLQTYQAAYDSQKSNSATAAILLAVSNISIAFGVNMVTATDTIAPGIFCLALGVLLICTGVYFNFFKDRG